MAKKKACKKKKGRFFLGALLGIGAGASAVFLSDKKNREKVGRAAEKAKKTIKKEAKVAKAGVKKTTKTAKAGAKKTVATAKKSAKKL
jgi:hypothetical protein